MILKKFQKELIIIVLLFLIIMYFIMFKNNSEDFFIELLFFAVNIFLIICIFILLIIFTVLVRNRYVEQNKIYEVYDYFFNHMNSYSRYIIIDMMFNDGRKSYNIHFAKYLRNLVKMGIITKDHDKFSLQPELDNALIHVVFSDKFFDIISTQDFKEEFDLNYHNQEILEEVNNFILKVQSGMAD